MPTATKTTITTAMRASQWISEFKLLHHSRELVLVLLGGAYEVVGEAKHERIDEETQEDPAHGEAEDAVVGNSWQKEVEERDGEHDPEKGSRDGEAEC